MTYQLIYSSQATAPMNAAELEKILVDARTGNEARQVSGALIYIDGVFLQILEGDKDTVLALMKSIARDTRHGSIKVFHEAEVDAPAFANWRMAYLDTTPEQMATWSGLEGTTTIESILEVIDRNPHGATHVARGVLAALAT